MGINEGSLASLLIVIGEPFEHDHVDLISNRVVEGLCSWRTDVTSLLVGFDLNTELLNFLNKSLKPEEKEKGCFLIRSEGQKLHVDILLNSPVGFFQRVLRWHLCEPFKYRHIIFAGSAFAGSGSWILNDGTFSLHDMARLFHGADVATALTTNPGTHIVISTLEEGEWCTAGLTLHEVNANADVSIASGQGKICDLICAGDLANYTKQLVHFTPIESLLKSSDVVGNLKFARPTAYIFPAGQGDCALLGVDGFFLLLDGGFQAKSQCWDFVRHFDRIDAVLFSRLSCSNLFGFANLMKRKAHDNRAMSSPKIGHAFGNFLPETQANTPRATKHPLLLSPFVIGSQISSSLAEIGLKPQTLIAASNGAQKALDPIVLYQKIGHGSLELFILNPVKDSKELKEFFHNWEQNIVIGASQNQKFTVKCAVDSAAQLSIPVSSLVSIALLVVWRPSEADDNITRILYPGSCPQDKLFAGLEKVKHLRYLQHSFCSESTLYTPPKAVPSTAAASAGLKKPSQATAGNTNTAAASKPTRIVSAAPTSSTKPVTALVSKPAPAPKTPTPVVGAAPSAAPVVVQSPVTQKPVPVPPSPQPVLQSPPLTQASNVVIVEQNVVSPVDTHSSLVPEPVSPTSNANRVSEADLYSTAPSLFSEPTVPARMSAQDMNHTEAFADALTKDLLVAGEEALSPFHAAAVVDKNEVSVSPAVNHLTSEHSPYDAVLVPELVNDSPLQEAAALGPQDPLLQLHTQYEGPTKHPDGGALIGDLLDSSEISSDIQQPTTGVAPSIDVFLSNEQQPISNGLQQPPPLLPDSVAPVSTAAGAAISDSEFEAIKEQWGQPLGLPSPMPPPPASSTGKGTGAAAAVRPSSSKAPPEKAVPSKTTATGSTKGAAAAPKGAAQPPTVKAKTAAPASKKLVAATSTTTKAASVANGKPPTVAAPKPAAPASSKAPQATKPASTKPGQLTAQASVPKKPAFHPAAPYYFDLVYVPHNANPYYCNAEFFKYIRSKHYVFSTLRPSKEALDALLAGKKAWANQDEVTLIPTYDSDTLSLWMTLHRDELVDQHIDVAPSAIRCTLNLQDQEQCEAYKLEF